MKKCYFLLLLPYTLFGQGINDLSGTVNFYYISRLSDGSTINLPYRIADIKWQREDDPFSIYSHLSMEYRVPNSRHFFDNTSPQDFSWDLQEFYLSWQLKNGEIRIGKQIHSWGSVDGNSPIDNLNAYDYYYLFESGAKQKIGSFSTAGDFYLEDWKFGFSVSPIHNTNRLPLNDPEFPVGLPVSPVSSQIIEVANPLEVGGYITKSFDRGDITLSYFDGYDRVFSPSGFNVWQNFEQDNLPIIDTLFSYRKTQVIGMGTVLFFGNLTLRGDFAYFTTMDPNNNLFNEEYSGTSMLEIQKPFYTHIREQSSKSLKVDAEYYQTNIQFEYEFPWNLQIAGQYFKYDTLRYFDDVGYINEQIEYGGVTTVDIEFDPVDYFSPGMGTNLAILTKNVLLFEITKTLDDNRVELSLVTMMDQAHSGKLIEIGFGYDISESVNGYLAVNKIIGDDSQDEKYTFNHMENFSHIRFELKYYY